MGNETNRRINICLSQHKTTFPDCSCVCVCVTPSLPKMATADDRNARLGDCSRKLQNHDERIANLEGLWNRVIKESRNRHMRENAWVSAFVAVVVIVIVYLVASTGTKDRNPHGLGAWTTEDYERARQFGQSKFGIGVGSPPRNLDRDTLIKWFGSKEAYQEWLSQPVSDRKVQEWVWEKQALVRSAIATSPMWGIIVFGVGGFLTYVMCVECAHSARRRA